MMHVLHLYRYSSFPGNYLALPGKELYRCSTCHMCRLSCKLACGAQQRTCVSRWCSDYLLHVMQGI